MPVADTPFYNAWTSNTKPAFEKNAEAVKNLSTKPTDTELLEIYGLFKQVTVGDVDTDRPGAFSFKEKHKWDAWKRNEGTGQEDAAKKYIEFTNDLIERYGT